MCSPSPCETDVQTSLVFFVNIVGSCSNGNKKPLILYFLPPPTTKTFYAGQTPTDFRGNQQHDAQEFSSWLLLALHDSEKSNPPSMFASLFTATMTSSLHCANKNCGFVSVTQNEYSILTLHFPKTDGLCTLEDLLQNFVAQEPLIGNNVANCQFCGQKSASSKALAIATTPAVLLVHLKRFHSNGLRRNNAVSFPLQGLRLPIADSATATTSTYDCVAVSNHYGAHYSTMAQRGARNSWFNINDIVTSAVPQEQPINLQNTHAYLLFYIRRTSCISQ